VEEKIDAIPSTPRWHMARTVLGMRFFVFGDKPGFSPLNDLSFDSFRHRCAHKAARDKDMTSENVCVSTWHVSMHHYGPPAGFDGCDVVENPWKPPAG